MLRFAVVLNTAFLVASSWKEYCRSKENKEKDYTVIERKQLLPQKEVLNSNSPSV